MMKRLTHNFKALLLFVICQAAASVYAQNHHKMESSKVGGYAPVNGISMYYEVHGQGAMPLVLIHGGGSTIESSFSKLLPLLAKHGKVIALELQAHGRTSDRPAPESFEQDADDVAALLKYLKIEKADFFGFSNGGTTTLQIAIRHPAIVHKIIDLAGAYQREGFAPGFFEGFKGATLDSLPAPLHTAFLAVNPDKKALQNMFDKDVARMIGFTDIADDAIRSIKAPALIITGNQDVMPPAQALKITELIPGARLLVLPGVHGACIGEICTGQPGSKLPEITAMLIEDFLKG